MPRKLRIDYSQTAQGLLLLARRLQADHEHPDPEARDTMIRDLEWAAAKVLGWKRPAAPEPKSRKKP